MQARDEDDLPLVIAEIGELMGASWCALSMHPTQGQPASMLYAGPSRPEPARIEATLAAATVYLASQPEAGRWLDDARGGSAYQVPIQVVPGHSPMAITMLFDGPSEEDRRGVEAMYLARRPFAVGYFRLWQLNRMRQRDTEQLEAVLNATEIGVMLLDRSGDIVFANAAADLALAAENGIRRRARTVRATHMSDSVVLQMAIEHVIFDTQANRGEQRISAPTLALRRTGGPPLIVAVLPTSTPAVEPTDVAAIMYVVDPSQDVAQTLAPLCRLYNLSPSETLLVCHLVSGRSVGEIATMMRIKEQTARGYLRQIFIKTATCRQTELIVLVLSSLIRMKATIVQTPLPVSEGRSAIGGVTIELRAALSGSSAAQ